MFNMIIDWLRYEGFDGVLLKIVIPCAMLFCLLMVCVGVRRECVCGERISQLGYSRVDVRIFLRSVGLDNSDFVDSESLRKQYEIFKNGGTSDWISKAQELKQSKDNRNSGFVTGMVVGSVMSRR